jgi:3-methyladenine DNA glycosylase AlkD
MDAKAVVKELRFRSDAKAAEGMKRFGIVGKAVLGVSVPELKGLGKESWEESQACS